MVAESERLERVDRIDESQVAAAIPSAVHIAVPDGTGEVEFLQGRQPAEALQVRRIYVDTEPVEHLEFDLARRKLGMVADEARPSGDADAATHGKRPLSHRAVQRLSGEQTGGSDPENETMHRSFAKH